MSRDVAKYDVYDVSRKLRERGWLVPAYTMPPKREDLAVLRVVVRNGFSHDMAELFLRDLHEAVDWLDGPQDWNTRLLRKGDHDAYFLTADQDLFAQELRLEVPPDSGARALGGNGRTCSS